MPTRITGPLRAFRIADERFPIFDGTGAARYGGRWNSPGRAAIYGALSYAGAMLERLAQTGLGRIPRRQRCMTIDVPAAVEIEVLEGAEVPGWDAEDLVASRVYGDAWLAEGRTAVLVVPSVVGWPYERNVVVNSGHPAFGGIVVGKAEVVRWDGRLAR